MGVSFVGSYGGRGWAVQIGMGVKFAYATLIQATNDIAGPVPPTDTTVRGKCVVTVVSVGGTGPAMSQHSPSS